MKKIILALLLAASFVLPLAAQSGDSEKTTPIWDHGDNVSDISYTSVPIYRVFQHKDAYVVYYQKQDLRRGTVVIPRKWAYGTAGRKLYFRKRPANLDSFMTVYYKGGEFYKVTLTVDLASHDAIWGILPAYTKLSGTDAESLTVEY